MSDDVRRVHMWGPIHGNHSITNRKDGKYALMPWEDYEDLRTVWEDQKQLESICNDARLEWQREIERLRTALKDANAERARYGDIVTSRLGSLESALGRLLDGLDANTDGRDGLTQEEWDEACSYARRALDGEEVSE